MKKIIVSFLLIVMIVSLCSCGTSKANEPDLTGTWLGKVGDMTSSFTFEKNGVGTAVNNAGNEIPFTYEIVDDSSIKFVFSIDGENIENISTYKLDGNELTLDEVVFEKQ